MKIKSLIVGGFKGVKDKVTIPLSSITLLFGANSTGKSTVLQSLLYLYEIVVNRDFDPQYSQVTGENLWLGGFKNLVNSRDLNKTITLGGTLDFSTDEGFRDDYLSESDAWLLESYFKLTPDATVDLFTFEIDIAWDRFQDLAYIKRYECYNNGHSFLCFETKAGKNNAVISHYEPLSHWHVEDEIDIAYLIYKEYQGCIPMPFRDALPPVTQRLDLSGISFGWSEQFDQHPHAPRIFVESSLSQAVLYPLKELSDTLSNLLQIGPLRVIPRGLLSEYSPSSKWYDGSIAWQQFAYGPKELKEQVNLYFGENGFKSHYEFDILKFGDEPMQQRQIVVNDLINTIKLNPSDIGVGLSQVFPFVVACNLEQPGMVSCEQPELHIHPKWQLVLADMMLRVCKKKPQQMFIIETHSEHLMLRLLKRRRQTFEKEIAENDPVACFKNDIQIIFCEQIDGKTLFRTIKTTDEGEFDSLWPNGFFEERRGELF